MDILDMNMHVTTKCYVEHLGAYGFHSQNNWEHDKAMNPTSYLRNLRADSIMYIEGLGTFPKI